MFVSAWASAVWVGGVEGVCVGEGKGGWWAFESVEFQPRRIRFESITIFLNTFFSNRFQTLQDY